MFISVGREFFGMLQDGNASASCTLLDGLRTLEMVEKSADKASEPAVKFSFPWAPMIIF
jgi:hypothetical protein